MHYFRENYTPPPKNEQRTNRILNVLVACSMGAIGAMLLVHGLSS